MINIVILMSNYIQESILKLYIQEEFKKKSINYKLVCLRSIEERKMISFTKNIDIAFILISKEDDFIINNLKMLVKLNPNIVNIFLSENSIQDIESLCSFRIFDFLPIPIEGHIFHKIFLRALNQVLAVRCRRNDMCINFTSQSLKIRLPVSQIVYLSREDGKTKIISKNNKIYISYKSLKFFESNLLYGFQRTSQDKIINMSEIMEIQKDTITLYNNYETKITRSFKKAFYETYYQNILL